MGKLIALHQWVINRTAITLEQTSYGTGYRQALKDVRKKLEDLNFKKVTGEDGS